MRGIVGLTTPAENTIRPSLDEFRRLAADHTVVPVWREYVADQLTPIAVFSRLCAHDKPGFLLESAENGEQWSRWSFIGRQAASLIRYEHGELSLSGEPIDPSVRTDAGVLAAIEDLLACYRSPDLPDLPPLHGGLVGYLGYDVVREVEHLPNAPDDDQGYPDAMLQVVGDMAAIDHFRQRVMLISNVFIPADSEGGDGAIERLYRRAMARLKQMATDLSEAEPEPLADPPSPDDEPPEVRSTLGGESYMRAVDVAKEHILAGDVFQVVLSQRFDFDLGADPFDVYRVLRQVNPSPYMYFFRTNRVSLVGSSPEPLVQLLGGRVISRPIAGTRRRGSTDEEDRRLGAELVEHPKERAEHVMLVDLARNDVGRVVTFGTEQVDEMMTLERYSHVMHLTSQVSGELAPGLTPVDVLRATLPAGTVSGAPKVRAMEIIDELEPVRRGPYAGVVGYLDFSGNIDTAIAIRTMVVGSRGRASVQAGAGVVADSIPEHEDLECHNKARGLLAAVAAARRMSARRLEYARSLAFGEKRYAGVCLKESVARVAIERDGIVLSGPDAGTFLQGQLSQDMSAIAPGDSAWSFVLQPDGKFLALVRVARINSEDYVVDTDSGQGDLVVERLRRFHLRVDCTISDVRIHPITALRGPASEALTSTLRPYDPLETTSWQNASIEPGLASATWPGSTGADYYLTGNLPGDVPFADGEALDALRIETGWPVSGIDLVPGDVPADAPRSVLDSVVSFTKGCYTGQELVERMDSRGASSPRPLRGIVLNGGSPTPPAGAEIVVGGEVVGTVTSAAFAPWRDAPIALARIVRRVTPPVVGVARWADGEAGARVVDLPFEPVPSFDRVPSV